MGENLTRKISREHLVGGRLTPGEEIALGVDQTLVQDATGTLGKTEEELQAAGIEYRKGVFPFLANGRARTLGQTEGWVKVLADTTTDRLLAVHILGPRAGDLIAAAAAAIAFGGSSEDIARTCHAHPTLAEALREAAVAIDGRALHA